MLIDKPYQPTNRTNTRISSRQSNKKNWWEPLLQDFILLERPIMFLYIENMVRILHKLIMI